MSKQIIALSCVVLLTASSCALGQDVLSGRVKELLPAEQAASGIPGVSVKVVDSSKKVVGQGITDGKGSYTVAVQPGIRGGVQALYEKVGYYSFPTPREVKSLKATQPDVFLSRGGASNEYYKAVAQGTVQVSSAGAAESSQAAAVIASLPSRDREKVMEELKATAPLAVIKEVSAAQKANEFSEAIRVKLRATGGGELELVRAQANFPKTGDIWLYGEVFGMGSKKNVYEIARSVEGVRDIKNDVWVKASELSKPK